MTETRAVYTTASDEDPRLNGTVQELEGAMLNQAHANDMHTRRVLLSLVDVIERRWCISPRTAECRQQHA